VGVINHKGKGSNAKEKKEVGEETEDKQRIHYEYTTNLLRGNENQKFHMVQSKPGAKQCQ